MGLNGVCHVVKYSKGRQVLSTKLSNVSQICTIDSSNRWSGKQWLVCYRDGSNWLYSGLEKLIRIHFDQPKNPDDFSVGQRINPASSSVFQNSSMLHSSAIHSNILGVSQNSSVFQSSNLLSEHHEKPRFGGIGESCLSPIAKSPDKNQSQFLMEISTPTTKTTRSNRQLKPNGQTNISNQLPFDFVGLVDNKNLLMKSEGGNLSCLLNLGNILPIELPDEVVRVLEALKSKVGKHILVELYSRFLNEFFRTRNQNKTFTLCFYSSLFEAKIQPKTLPLGVEQSPKKPRKQLISESSLQESEFTWQPGACTDWQAFLPTAARTSCTSFIPDVTQIFTGTSTRVLLPMCTQHERQIVMDCVSSFATSIESGHFLSQVGAHGRTEKLDKCLQLKKSAANINNRKSYLVENSLKNTSKTNVQTCKLFQRYQTLQKRFPNDTRFHEVMELIDTSSKIAVDFPDSTSGLTDVEVEDKRRIYLWAAAQRQLAANFGKQIINLNSVDANLNGKTSKIDQIVLSGRCVNDNTALDFQNPDVMREHRNNMNMNEDGITPQLTVQEKLVTERVQLWPRFHNGVAYAFSLDLENDVITRDWLAKKRIEQRSTDSFVNGENKENVLENDELLQDSQKPDKSVEDDALSIELRSWQHAGFLFGLALKGKLNELNKYTLAQYFYLGENHTTSALLVGQAIGSIGTADWQITRAIAAHIPALNDSDSQQTDYVVNINTQYAAVMAIGFLFHGTRDRKMLQVLLESAEAGPVDLGDNTSSGTAANMNSAAANTNTNQRNIAGEALLTKSSASHAIYSQVCVFSIGMIYSCSGIGSKNDMNLDSTNLKVITRLMRLAGLGDTNLMNCMNPVLDETGVGLVSLEQNGGEELERLNGKEDLVLEPKRTAVDVDSTSPAALISLAMIFQKSGNKIILDSVTEKTKCSIKNYPNSLRPDLIMLRKLCEMLISKDWTGQLEMQEFVILEDVSKSLTASNSGVALSLAIKSLFLKDVYEIQQELFINAKFSIKLWYKKRDNSTLQYMSNAVLALSLCLNSTGDLNCLKLIRNILTIAPRIDSDSNKPEQSSYYGLYLACYLGIGLLFMNECQRKVRKVDKTDVCLLLLACFPRWPSDTCDQRYHPQMFRHLITYVLGIKEDKEKASDNSGTTEFKLESKTSEKCLELSDSDIMSSDDEMSDFPVSANKLVDADLGGLGFDKVHLESFELNIEKIDDILLCLK